MRVFIWEDAENVTDRYHAEGGIVVFAETIKRARELVEQECGDKCSAINSKPIIRNVEGGKEAIYIFPNAGCC